MSDELKDKLITITKRLLCGGINDTGLGNPLIISSGSAIFQVFVLRYKNVGDAIRNSDHIQTKPLLMNVPDPFSAKNTGPSTNFIVEVSKRKAIDDLKRTCRGHIRMESRAPFQ